MMIEILQVIGLILITGACLKLVVWSFALFMEAVWGKTGKRQVPPLDEDE